MQDGVRFPPCPPDVCLPRVATRALRHRRSEMDVTAANFDAAAELLESLLPTCSFYAIDEEMTGIMLNKETAPSMADTCEQRYAKMKRVVMPHEARTPH